MRKACAGSDIAQRDCQGFSSDKIRIIFRPEIHPLYQHIAGKKQEFGGTGPDYGAIIAYPFYDRTVCARGALYPFDQSEFSDFT